jgi:hypothetical protein
MTKMKPDLKRVRTYLSYKGFQWEPMRGQEAVAGGSGDFRVRRKAKVCFHGTLITIGKEQPSDGLPIRAVTDEKKKVSLQQSLALQLNQYVQRLDRICVDATLPNVVLIVNHELSIGFEDLPLVLDISTSEAFLNIHLYIWFDDLRKDQMLFNRSDANHFARLSHWFQAD